MAGVQFSEILDELYFKYNRRDYIHPDPLEFLYKYKAKRDQEIVGLIAASLAYGKVAQILKSVSLVLDVMGDSPYEYLMSNSESKMMRDFVGFKHRFTTGEDLCQLLCGICNILKKYDSLESCFVACMSMNDDDLAESLSSFVKELGGSINGLLPDPSRGSACKRLNLFLKWMVRSDEVDVGCWSLVPKSKLIIPLDTHMHNISRQIGFTKRLQADMKTALEVTGSFAKINADDPTKYDFALTRFGIRSELKIEDLIRTCTDIRVK